MSQNGMEEVRQDKFPNYYRKTASYTDILTGAIEQGQRSCARVYVVFISTRVRRGYATLAIPDYYRGGRNR